MPTNPYINHNVRLRLTLATHEPRKAVAHLLTKEAVQEVTSALNTYAYTVGF